MVVCQFFLQGRCKFGESCKNEHPGASGQSNRFAPLSNGSGGRARSGGFGGGGDRYRPGQDQKLPFHLDKDAITADLTPSDRPKGEKPEWQLSCYGPGRDAPRQLLEGALEQSMEEMRVMCYLAGRENKLQEYLNHEGNLKGQALQQAESIVKDVDGAVQYVIDGEKAANNRNNEVIKNAAPTSRPAGSGGFGQPSGLGNVPPSSSFGQPSGLGGGTAFGRMAEFGQQSSAFGQPSQSGGGSAFGQPSQPASGSAFGKPSPLGGGGTGFGQPSPLGGGRPAFGQPSHSGGSAFGQPSQPGGAAFGQPSQPGSTGSAFGAPSALGGQKPAFGQAAQPAFGQSSFNQAAKPAFGAPSQPGGQQSSPFGGGQQQQQSSTFGGQSSQPNPFAAAAKQPSGFGQVGQSGLGQPSASGAPSGGSGFGTSGSPAGNNPFGSKPAAPAFGAPSQPVSAFGQPAQTNGTTQPVTGFGQASQPAPSTSGGFGGFGSQAPAALAPPPQANGSATGIAATASYTTRSAGGHLRTWKNQPVEYEDESGAMVPYHQIPHTGKKERIWHPNGPPEKLNPDAGALDSQIYLGDIGKVLKDVYEYVRQQEDFKDLVPEIPPKREWVRWDL